MGQAANNEIEELKIELPSEASVTTSVPPLTGTVVPSQILSAAPIDEISAEIQAGTYAPEMEEENDDDYADGKVLTNEKYEAPSEADKFIDTVKGEVVDKTKLTDFDMIKAVAKQNNIEIRNPRSGCKHCYGRGFTGRDYKTKQPIPCNCIYPPKAPNQKVNEAIYDKSKPRMDRNMLKKIKKLIRSEKRKAREQQYLDDLKQKENEIEV